MADESKDDFSLLRLIAPFKSLGEESMQNLAKLARERPDSFDVLVSLARQDKTTIENIIRIGRLDKSTVDNLIMIGLEPKETVGTIIQVARERQNSDKGNTFRWQLVNKWAIFLGGIGVIWGILQVAIPWLTTLLKKAFS